MPRKGPAPKRPLIVDPVYGSPLVSQLVNKVLLDGKKSTAERIVYQALEGCREKNGTDPVITLKRALDNVKPTLEVKSRRVGGATYQVPIEVKPRPGDHAGAALADHLLPRPPREDHDRPADERDPRRQQRPGCRGEAPRGHAQDGRVEQGVRALPLVIDGACAVPTDRPHRHPPRGRLTGRGLRRAEVDCSGT